MTGLIRTLPLLVLLPIHALDKRVRGLSHRIRLELEPAQLGAGVSHGPEGEAEVIVAVVVEDALGHGEDGLGADVADELAVLPAVDEELCAVGARGACVVGEAEAQGHVPAGGYVEGEVCGEEADAGVGDAVLDGALAVGPGRRRGAQRAGEVEAVALDVQAAFVERAARLVGVVLASEVAGDFPGDGRLVVAAVEDVVHDTTWVLCRVIANAEVLVETHAVDYDGEDV